MSALPRESGHHLRREKQKHIINSTWRREGFMAKDSGVFFANRPIRYVTKDDLMFQGLARSSGKEIVRLRFSRPYGAELEIPLQTRKAARSLPISA